MEIYERIKILRKDYLKITQDEFGQLLGVSRDVIKNIENNRLVKPEQKEPIYKLICKEFKISYSWLITGLEPMEEPIDSNTMTKIDFLMSGENETAKAVFKEFSKLGEDEWDMLGEFILNIGKSINDNKRD